LNPSSNPKGTRPAKASAALPRPIDGRSATAVAPRPGELAPANLSRKLAIAVERYEAGRLSDAEAICLDVLAADVRFADALYLLGMIGYRSGRLEMAERMIRRAIAVDGSQAFYHSNLGNALIALGKVEESVACFERAFELRPDLAEISYNLANTLQKVGRLEEAADFYRRALEIEPDRAETLCNLGNALNKLERLDEAELCFRRALDLKPDYAEALSNLGVAVMALERVDEAIGCFERALALKPDCAEALNNLGNAFWKQGKLDSALACSERALALRPNYVEAHYNRGVVHYDGGELEAAAASFERALALRPDYADAHMDLSFTQLVRGDFANGWRNYEWRFEQKARPRIFPQPLWRGQPLHGARILLHAEQGLGDSLQFLRFVPMVQAAGGEVVLDIPARLRRIAELLPGLAALVDTGAPLPPFDWHCPLMSLPLAFDIAAETIPCRVPYLSVPEDARRTAASLSWPSAGLRVGLVWGGNPEHRKDRIRSLPLALLEPLFAVPGARFFSLQMGAPAAQLATVQAKIADLGAVTGDMADTAAQIAQLDLIVAVDTSIVHLAGALAKPVWVLLSAVPDWRWLLHRNDSPWYPTARLFRQPKLGDWASVVAEVQIALREECTRFSQGDDAERSAVPNSMEAIP
jgi:tetratricopeptide (TPR) repeat protein